MTRPTRSIFISYRRDDTEGQAGRLFKDLRDAFGEDAVFMDVMAIPPGVDFRKAIEEHIGECGVVLALIGRDWLVTDSQGRRRLDDANDFVRIETASALRRGIPVIPVLVKGARMPHEEQLPDDLKELAYRNAVEISHARWDSDVQLLINALRPIVNTAVAPACEAVSTISPSSMLPEGAQIRADQPGPPSKKPSLWRNLYVVGALVGVLSLLALVSTQYFPQESSFDFSVVPVSARLTEIQRGLKHRVWRKPDIETRRRAITALVILSGEQPPDAYYEQAIRMLTEYVKDNIDARRGPGEQVEIDPRIPAYRPADIIDALKGLQVIRRASGEREKVSLDSVDFHQINLEKLDLEGFYFGHADFTNAILSDCRCRGADFRHARFRGTAIWGTTALAADFREANFLRADLAGSKWKNVDFTGSNIEMAVGHHDVEHANLRGVDPAIFK